MPVAPRARRGGTTQMLNDKDKGTRRFLPNLFCPPPRTKRAYDHTHRSLDLRALMATWVRESLNDLQPGLSVSRTSKFSVLNVQGTRAAMVDAADVDVVMSEAPKKAAAAAGAKPSKKGGGKGAASGATAEAPAKKGGRGGDRQEMKGIDAVAQSGTAQTRDGSLNGRTAVWDVDIVHGVQSVARGCGFGVSAVPA